MPFRAETAAEVLAIVLCPAGAFARGRGQKVQAAAALHPMKQAIVRRFWMERTKL